MKFVFSVIIPFFNAENYLNNSIKSLINQELSFEDNVQLILVNDGSDDNSYDIASNFQSKYPNNIILLSQNHLGVSQARNNALNYVDGEYITFLDADDYISPNTLKEVHSFFNSHEDINIVSIPLVYFGAKKGEHELNHKFSENDVIDLNENPNNPQLSVVSTFIKSNILNNLKFNTELISSEDSLFINQLLLNNRKIGVINSCTYHYRKCFDLKGIKQNVLCEKTYYISTLKKFYLNILSSLKEVPEFIKYTIAYDLQFMIMQEELTVFDTQEEIDNFWLTLKEVLKYIDIDIFRDNDLLDYSYVCFMLKLKNGKYNTVISENNNIQLKIQDMEIDNLNNHTIWIYDLSIINNHLHIKGFVKSFFNKDNLKIIAYLHFGDKTEKFVQTDVIDQFRTDDYFLSKTSRYTNNFLFNIPLNDVDSLLDLKICYCDENTEIINDNLIIKFSKNVNNKFLTDDSHLIKFEDNKFVITKKFTFSVIMAFYNSEQYLHESIDSVINQSIGFKQHVQLILVNDGSTDGSLNIALDYQKRFPENILVLDKENGGQASARNYGLEFNQAEYVNFLDSDDKFSENVLKEVYDFYQLHHDEVDVVSVPLIFFERKEGDHNLNYKFNNTEVIDLQTEPNNPQLHIGSSFIKYNNFENIRFNTKIIHAEDALVINKILLNKKHLGVINNAAYYYRKRADLSSTIDQSTTTKKNFTEMLQEFYLNLINYSLLQDKEVPKFIQYMLAYDLQFMLNQPTLNILDNNSEKSKFWHYLHKVLDYLDPEVIINNKNINQLNIGYMYSLKNRNKFFVIKNNDVILKTKNYQIDKLSNHKIWINILEVKDNHLNISGFLNSYFDVKNLSFEAIKRIEGKEDETFIFKNVKYGFKDVTVFLDEEWHFPNFFDVSIPINIPERCVIILKTNYHIDGNTENFSPFNIVSCYLKVDFSNHSNLSEFSDYIISNEQMIVFKNNHFHLIPTSNKTMLKNEFKLFKRIINQKPLGFMSILLIKFLYLICYPLIKFIKRDKRIYLYMDRPESADDNASNLFKYANSKNENIKNYLILSKDAKEYNDFSKIGNIVAYKSIKHKLLFLYSDKIISSHPYDSVINPFYNPDNNEDKRKFFNGYKNYKLYFLQHGVTLGNISSWMTKYDKNLSLFVTVSDKERESLLIEGYNYDEKIIQTLGFPRYDNLNNNQVKKQILLIPTWRKHLKGNKNYFLNSSYYERLMNLLNDEKLIKLAKNNGYKILFKPHPELERKIENTNEKYIDLLKINPEIEIVSNVSYRKLFNESSLLITDFSSVFFDFAYLNKPVIYYQPDDDYHYDESYFDYYSMGFGEIIQDKERLLQKIKYYVENQCQMEQKYKERVKSFFKYNDNNNCQRVYDCIKNN